MAKDNCQLIVLPDRKLITLCEAVTAFISGKACNSTEWHRARLKEPADPRGLEQGNTLKGRKATRGTTELVETSNRRAEDLLERLHGAAYAGRVKFRAIQENEDPADGYKDIDPLYFYIKPSFHWSQDVIVHLENDLSTPWYFVHLDREQFVALLRDMGVSVKQGPEPDPQGERKTYRTGGAGRPTSIHFVLKMAQRRLDTADYPDTFRAFSELLAAELKATEPEATPMQPKTMRNNAELRDLWRRRAPKIIDRS